MDAEMTDLVAELAVKAAAKGYFLGTAESCTGGWVAQSLTARAGSSEWFDAGFVTYSNAAKQRQLGVSEQTLSKYGAVSEATVVEMAQGVLQNSNAQLSVAISGIAGPGGGTTDKPVGTVWLAWAEEGIGVRAEVFCFQGDRECVRKQAVIKALQGFLRNLSV